MCTALAQNIQAENMLEILTPPPYLSAQSDNLHIVGKTNAPIVEVFLNDEKLYDLIVKDSIFHASIQFGYGIIEVTIVPIYSGESATNVQSATIEIMYGPEISRKYKKIFLPYEYHKTENISDCNKCHDEYKNNFDSLSTDSGCLVCHKGLGENFKRHTKVDNKTCVNCHQQNSPSANFTSYSNTETNLCFNCHTDKIGLFSQDYIHGPVAGGSCIICHNPHGSKFDYLLVSPEQVLCFSCHINLEEETEYKRIIHKPFLKGQCGACHDPHSTSNKWVLRKSSEEVCLECHDSDKSMKWHSHPYNFKPNKRLRVDVQLSENGKIECLSCHNPHATDSEHLLRITEEFTCIGCHKDIL